MYETFNVLGCVKALSRAPIFWGSYSAGLGGVAMVASFVGFGWLVAVVFWVLFGPLVG